MMRVIFTCLFIGLSIGFAFSQANGDYRSDQNGEWRLSTTWQVFFNGAWRNLETSAAGPFRNVIPSSTSGTITVRNYVTVTTNVTTNQTVVATGGLLFVTNGKTFRIQDDLINTPLQINLGGRLDNAGILDLQTLMSSIPCQVFGTLSSRGTVLSTNPSLLIFNANSTYSHTNVSGGNIPIATWDISSTCEIAGLTKSGPARPGNLNQSFGNFRWNTPSMGASTGFSLGGLLQNVMGNLTFVSTGSTIVRFGNGGSGINLTVGGNFSIQGGLVMLAQSLTTASTINLTGDMVISGGILILGNNNTAINVLLNGNFVKTGGTLLRGSGTGSATIRFDGGTQTYANNAAITTAVNFSVQSGSTLNLGTAFLTGTGTFTLFSGGTINVGSTDAGGAIQLGTSGGNIRMSGTRTYQTGSTIVYNGSAAQFMGNGQPPLPNTVIDNLNGVTLVSNVIVANFTITNGTFDLGANNTVRINGNFIVNDTFEAQQGLVRFGGSAPQTISGSSAVTFFNFELNQTVNSTLAIATNVSIENNLSINSGSTLNAGNQLLTLLSTPTRTANVNSLATIGASIVGSVIVQRHLPKAASSRKSFHYIASPVTNTQFTDWTADESLMEIYQYQEPLRRHVRVTGLTATIQNGRGYSAFINQSGTFDLDVRGTLAQGNINIPLTSQDPDVDSPDGWNLIGNPYPSAIDWDNITLPAGVYDAVYTTDNFNNSGQETGNGVITYAVAYVDGVGTPASYTGAIAQGQSFWVKAIAPTETLTITESAKISATNTQFYREGEIANVLRITLNGQGVNDEAVVRLRDGATDGFDGKYDAYKFLKGDISLSTLTADNVQAVINAFGTADCNKAIPLVPEGVVKGESYSLNFVGMESFSQDVTISLVDLLEKVTIDVRNQDTYSFTIPEQNIDSISARFKIIIDRSALVANTDLKAFGETICEDNEVATISLENSEPGIQYVAEWKGEIISEPITGTGSKIQMSVNTSILGFGENAITIRAQAGSCSMAALAEKPIITRIKKSEITSVQEGNICNGGSTTLIASGAMENGWYHWYEDESDLEPIPEQNGAEFITPHLTKSKTYYVAAVNTIGCEGGRVPVPANVSHMEIEEVVITVEGSTLISSAQANNQWYLNNELLAEETSNILKVIEPGLYTVTVTYGTCSATASKEISFIAEEDALDAADLTIYPNPTRDKVIIKVKTFNNNVTATMVNASGIEMETKVLTGDTHVREVEFDMLPYATGIYNVRIMDGKKVFVKKIAKVK